jgi:hypothetical protein
MGKLNNWKIFFGIYNIFDYVMGFGAKMYL